ncbi:MAG: DUF3858 domain-containing protein [Chitinophagaceae bacterium]
MKKLKLLLLLQLLTGFLFAQDYSKLKFGDVSEKDFANKTYSVDTGAGAIVIADIGSTKVVSDNKTGFLLVFRHYRRVHILKKNGYDMASFGFTLFKDKTAEEKLDKFKAVTYNLVNGKVTETKLDTKSELFSEKLDKNRTVKKFTFPNVKEGSIIEFEYSIKSDYLTYPQPWEFQGEYPRLWSEYSITVPNFLYYVFLSQGYLQFAAEDRKDGVTSYNIREGNAADQSKLVQMDVGSAEYRWAVRDAPGLKEERFMSSMDNHIQKITFQLSELREPYEYQKVIESWPQVTAMLMESPDFGLELKQDPGWMNEVAGQIPSKGGGKLNRAREVYKYVRDNYVNTGNSLWLEKSLKEAARLKKGNVAEINLTLVALLRHEGIMADPVILSTRSNGLTYAEYPMLFRFNYVVARARIDGREIYLDAADPGAGFGHLPLSCYNGHSRVVDAPATAVYFNADSVMERKRTEVRLTGFSGGAFTGTYAATPGYYESSAIRKVIREKGLTGLRTEEESVFAENIRTKDWTADSVDQEEQPVLIKAGIEVPSEEGDIIYFNPWITGAYKQNPFKAENRLYPVELPYAVDETYTLTMNVPAGYVVSELPKDLIVKYNSKGEGLFEYRITRSGEQITLQSRILLQKANFPPGEYNRLRDFYSQIIVKQAEQFVFKKKK